MPLIVPPTLKGDWTIIKKVEECLSPSAELAVI